MNDLNRTARVTGLVYLVMSVLMVFGYMYVPAQFFASGDPAEAARRIAEGATMYRFTVWIALVSQILFVYVALNLYELFQDVDRKWARFMATLVCVGVAAELVNVANRMTPLLLASGADSLSGLTQAQRDALAWASHRSSVNLGQLLTSLWGLWLFPFGFLTMKSGFFPKFLGLMLMAAGAGYLISCTTFIVFPEQLPLVSRVVSPLYFGELPIVFWLLIFGTKRAPFARLAPLVSQE